MASVHEILLNISFKETGFVRLFPQPLSSLGLQGISFHRSAYCETTDPLFLSLESLFIEIMAFVHYIFFAYMDFVFHKDCIFLKVNNKSVLIQYTTDILGQLRKTLFIPKKLHPFKRDTFYILNIHFCYINKTSYQICNIVR